MALSLSRRRGPGMRHPRNRRNPKDGARGGESSWDGVSHCVAEYLSNRVTCRVSYYAYLGLNWPLAPILTHTDNGDEPLDGEAVGSLMRLFRQLRRMARLS